MFNIETAGVSWYGTLQVSGSSEISSGSQIPPLSLLFPLTSANSVNSVKSEHYRTLVCHISMMRSIQTLRLSFSHPIPSLGYTNRILPASDPFTTSLAQGHVYSSIRIESHNQLTEKWMVAFGLQQKASGENIMHMFCLSHWSVASFLPFVRL